MNKKAYKEKASAANVGSNYSAKNVKGESKRFAVISRIWLVIMNLLSYRATNLYKASPVTFNINLMVY